MKRRDFLKVTAALPVAIPAVGSAAAAEPEWTMIPPEPIGGEQAVSADAFADSFGVCAHFGWANTIWDTEFENYRPRIAELGVRYYRTTAGWASIPKIEALYGDNGTRFLFLLNLKTKGLLDASKIGKVLGRIRNKVGVDKTIGVEGPNEPNSDRDTNPDWADQVRAYQKALYDAVKADADLKHLPVVGPSIWRRIIEDWEALGNIDEHVEIANLHYYTGGRKPTVWSEYKGGERPIEDALNYANGMAPTAPVWVTETGYNSVPDTTDSPWSPPDAPAAKYILRLFAELFRRGPGSRNFLYNLIDDPTRTDRQYGLLRSDMTPKPAFYAIRNAIRVLADPGPAFIPGKLQFSLSGDMTMVNHFVAQKQDGRFYLVLWLDAESYDRENMVEVDIPPRDLTLDVSSHGFSTANIYLPTGQDHAVETIAAPTKVALAVPDEMMIVELVPRSARTWRRIEASERAGPFLGIVGGLKRARGRVMGR